MSGWDVAGIGLLGAAGFGLSYDALQQTAEAIQVREPLTYAFPLVVDGFIAYGVRALVLLREAKWTARLYTWSLFSGATSVSIWANALHAITLNQQRPSHGAFHLQSAAVGALSTLAPLGLAGATHLYIMISRHAPTVPDSELAAPEDDSEMLSVQAERTGDPGKIRSWWRTRLRRTRSDAPELHHAQALADQTRLRQVSGPSGPVSVPGPSGPVSVPGSSGPVSVPGSSGPVSVPGSSGPVSVPGPSGPVPVPGPSGPVPVPGPSGPVPVPGPSGPVSVPGPSGPVSVPGPSGPVSVPGPSGPVPVPGPSGPVPASGPSGPVSVPGSSGPVPVPGPSGPVPVPGPSGPVPVPGSSGPVPASGPSGPVPASGSSGPVPVPGPSGPVPASGSSGPVPASGPSGPVPASGSSGPVPASGPSGPVPASGPSGPVPASGPSGPVPVPGSSGPVPASGPSGPVPVPGPSGPVPASGSSGPVPTTGRARVKLEVLVPVARKAAARAGRTNREVVAAGLRDEGYSISNERMGKLLRMIEDTDAQPPPTSPPSSARPSNSVAHQSRPTPNSLPRKRS
ncbi:DUF2637 domain-containing protein [Kitasatospora sp. NPDC056184]|uniref:DUF2637 domain-containing protein n=1 Tax=Kitasatospora sp. NPDC056184 TaxID=3345738 RepID=UPI0035D7A146